MKIVLTWYIIYAYKKWENYYQLKIEESWWYHGDIMFSFVKCKNYIESKVLSNKRDPLNGLFKILQKNILFKYIFVSILLKIYHSSSSVDSLND